MKKKKTHFSKKYIFALVVFVILFLGLLIASTKKKPSEEPISEETNTETEKENDDTQKIDWENDPSKEVNADNDREHDTNETIINIEGMQEYIEPVLHWRQYLVYDRLKTYVERYCPEVKSATCIGASVNQENTNIMYFYLELHGYNGMIVEAEYDANVYEVSVRECTRYTKEEILKEVWIFPGRNE